jgi:hypothetical protein
MRRHVALVLVLEVLVLARCDPRDVAIAPDSNPVSPPSTVLDAPSSEGPAPISSLPPSSASASSAPEGPAPPYDLPADLASRTAAARSFFPEVPPALFSTRVVGDTFLLISSEGPAMLAAGAAQLRRALAFYYSVPFARHADHAVSVYLFATRRAFLDFARSHYDVDASRLYGFFRRTPHDLVVSGREGLGTLTHEMIHPIIEADFPRAPLWIDEGIGSLFEQPVFSPDGTMHGQSNRRYARLQKALSAGVDGGEPAPSLVTLFAMSTHEFRGGNPIAGDGGIDRGAKEQSELLHYAMARSFCQWLDSRHRALWRFYHAWRDGFAGDPTGELAFAAVMKSTPAALDGDWRAWVLAQPR